MEKQQPLQQVMMGKLDRCRSKNKTGVLPSTEIEPGAFSLPADALTTKQPTRAHIYFDNQIAPDSARYSMQIISFTYQNKSLWWALLFCRESCSSEINLRISLVDYPNFLC